MIVVRLAGGLGNQLFQYAFGRALAHRHNVPLKLDQHWFDAPRYGQQTTQRSYALDLFDLPVQLATSADVAQYVPFLTQRPQSWPGQYAQRFVQKVSRVINARYIQENDPNWFDPGMLTTAPADCYVAGYWQSERYFRHIQSLLRAELRFAAPLSGRALALATYMQTVEAVCVHVRRTDFLTDCHQVSLTPEQVRQGVDALRSRGIAPVLFIFSDDTDWCRQQIRAHDVPVYFVAEEVGEDAGTHFQLMTHCRHFILSVSTFSWWAAWLASHPDQLVFHPPHRRSGDWSVPHWKTLPEVYASPARSLP